MTITAPTISHTCSSVTSDDCYALCGHISNAVHEGRMYHVFLDQSALLDESGTARGQLWVAGCYACVKSARRNRKSNNFLMKPKCRPVCKECFETVVDHALSSSTV